MSGQRASLTPLLEARGITKAYPGVLAVDDVSLTLEAGEIHGIVGENGAGKTTLMKILAGLTQPDSGALLLRGERLALRSPSDAIAAGIGMVQQHFALVPTMTVAENIALAEMRVESRSRPALLPLDFRKLEDRVRQLSATYRIEVPPTATVEELSVGLEQRVELLRTLYLSRQVLILDEPTAVLTPQEVRELMRTLRKLAESGAGILFVSHHLQEVLDFTDRITVMRGGRRVKTVSSTGASKAELARTMIGAVPPPPERPPAETKGNGGARLETRDLWVRGKKQSFSVRGVSFEIRPGEVLGIAGIDGNGQVELADAIAGLRPVARGTVLLEGREVTNWPVKRLQRSGLAYIPADRRRNGLALGFDAAENLILREFDQPPYSRWGLLRRRTIRQHAERTIRDFDIRVPSGSQNVSTLSGGNQQKLVLARELQNRPQVLISCYATRGLDVAAVASLQAEIRKASVRGTSVLYISNEIQELLESCDRIAVLTAGEIAGIVDPTQTDEERLGLLMGHN